MRRRVEDTGRSLAIGALSLYALNLLFPLLPMLTLLVIFWRRYKRASDLARMHMRQSLLGCGVSTLIFVGLNLVVVSSGGYSSVTSLNVFLFYFVAIAPLLLIPGFFGLLKAMSEEPYQFPLIGRLVETKV